MRETRYVLIDDIDGSDAVETFTFSVGRQFFEIDLNMQHSEQFKADFAKWIEYARKTVTPPAPAQRQTTPRADAIRIREWAKAQGIELSPRGRIPTDVRAQYYSKQESKTID